MENIITSNNTRFISFLNASSCKCSTRCSTQSWAFFYLYWDLNTKGTSVILCFPVWHKYTTSFNCLVLMFSQLSTDFSLSLLNSRCLKSDERYFSGVTVDIALRHPPLYVSLSMFGCVHKGMQIILRNTCHCVFFFEACSQSRVGNIGLRETVWSSPRGCSWMHKATQKQKRVKRKIKENNTK